MPGDVGYSHTEALLLKLGDAADRFVLIGGQAVNFWAWFYEGQAPDLKNYAPFTSKDVDVAATRRDVAELAKRIGGTAKLAGLDDHTPESGLIFYEDDDGIQRTLDVMGIVTGIDSDDLNKTSVPIDYDTADGRRIHFRVMHPVLVMESRTCNVLASSKYRTEHGFRQLRASVLCARHYLLDMLSNATTRPREVLKWNERIFRFRTNQCGRQIMTDYGVNVFEAIVVDPRLPVHFMNIRYPQMLETLANK